MAYELKYGQSLKQGDEDEEQRNSLFGAAANATAATAAQPTAGAGAAQPGGSGRFVNFERYLNANLGSADRTAGQLEHDVNNTAGLADAQVKTAVRTQNDRIGQSTQPWVGSTLPVPGDTGGVTSQTGNLKYNADGTTSTPYQTTTGPGLQSVAPTDISYDDAVARGQTGWDVSGIANSGEFGTAVERVGKANQQLNALGSSAGLQGLLQEQNKSNNGYTQGMSRLDAALVGGVGNPRFDALRKRYGGLDKMLTGAIDDDVKARQVGQQTTEASAGKYRDLVAEYEAELERKKQRDAEQAKNEAQQRDERHYTFR